MINLTLVKAANLVNSGQISAVELVKATLQHIESVDYNAFISVFFEESIKRAEQIDKTKGSLPLKGVPIAIKDNIDIQGVVSTCGSAVFCDSSFPESKTKNVLGKFKAKENAFVVERLLAAGAIIIGKSNMDEFAMGSSNTTSAFGRVKGPIEPNAVPGGSSGGSACSVATNQCYAALGSDTGGSIRQPASYCGVVGLKPTFGSVSRHGCFPLAPSLDQIGPIARNIADTALVFSVIAAEDRQDKNTQNKPRNRNFDNMQPKKAVIGLIKELESVIKGDALTAYSLAIKKLENAGCEIKYVEIPHILSAHSIYCSFAFAEIADSMERIKENRHLFGSEVKRRIIAGRLIKKMPDLYQQGCNLRGKLAAEMNAALCGVDCLMMPSAPSAAFSFDEKNKEEIEFSDIFTQPASIAGLPAVSLPFYNNERGLPVGIQLVGRMFQERVLFETGLLLQ
jgi:aspartyl-tRNA(Asn)/glutamyl-tRNA(Gln) amidotransferase subunit A